MSKYSICVVKLRIKEKKPEIFKSSKRLNSRRLQQQNRHYSI